MIPDLLGAFDGSLLNDSRSALHASNLDPSVDELEPEGLDGLLARLQLVAVQVEPYAIFAELVALLLELFAEQPQVVTQPLLVGLEEADLLAVRLVPLCLGLQPARLPLEELALELLPF